eukprot:3473181-Rhodomonas_salina.3
MGVCDLASDANLTRRVLLLTLMGCSEPGMSHTAAEIGCAATRRLRAWRCITSPVGCDGTVLGHGSTDQLSLSVSGTANAYGGTRTAVLQTRMAAGLVRRSATEMIWHYDGCARREGEVKNKRAVVEVDPPSTVEYMLYV